jgi:hypothetical protein
MSTKTSNTSNLYKTLSKIIKEELSALKEQEIHSAIERLGSRKKDLAAWLMRQYFSNDQKGSAWYDSSVTKDNVLKYISVPSNNFPLSPTQVSDFFRNMKSLQKKMSSREVSADLDDITLDDADDDTSLPGVKYNTGDVTLKDIGAQVGGVTAAMINKIEGDGLGKLQSLLGGKHPRDLDADDERELNRKFAEAESNASERYADMLVASNGNIGKFLMSLVKSHILSNNEAEQITDNEIEALMTLAKMPKERIKQILSKDLNSPRGNVIKTFQSMYSKTIFPPKKRGRKPSPK